MLLILIQFWYLHNIYMFIAAPRLSSSSSAWAVVRSTPRPSSKAFRTGTPGNKSMATSVCCLSVDLFESIWIYLNLFESIWSVFLRNQWKSSARTIFDNPISWSFRVGVRETRRTHMRYMRARVLDVGLIPSQEASRYTREAAKRPMQLVLS